MINWLAMYFLTRNHFAPVMPVTLFLMPAKYNVLVLSETEVFYGKGISAGSGFAYFR
jgi:hypothetical protein